MPCLVQTKSRSLQVAKEISLATGAYECIAMDDDDLGVTQIIDRGHAHLTWWLLLSHSMHTLHISGGEALMRVITTDSLPTPLCPDQHGSATYDIILVKSTRDNVEA